ncbi:hypothetical protein [Micromonospora sp. NBC_01813]|uniref:hypothetical protein n=1 Tax=Micromonospora sp. NBC_01813 TaxID=2975988 RepID=UPI002DDC5696|nr:hypothetical protein [Micromonospora sp. NBC_01813]WSA12278.1 hypothetical protein OG958_16715 [Micromonospora sp. NBC_01813]
MNSPSPPEANRDSRTATTTTRRSRTRAIVVAIVVVLLVLAVVVATVWYLNRSASEATQVSLPAAPSASALPSQLPSGDPAGSGSPVGELFITPNGIGALRISQSVDGLTQAGSLGPDADDFCPDRLVGQDELSGVVVYTAEDDSASLILVGTAPLSTAEGVAVGSTSAQLREAYGEQLDRHTAANNPYAENYLVSDGTSAIGFTVSQDAVDKILVAPADVLRAVFDVGELHC